MYSFHHRPSFSLHHGHNIVLHTLHLHLFFPYEGYSGDFCPHVVKGECHGPTLGLGVSHQRDTTVDPSSKFRF